MEMRLTRVEQRLEAMDNSIIRLERLITDLIELQTSENTEPQ